MDLNALKNTKKILNQHNIKPFKGLGQNFLIDKRILSTIIKAADIKPEDIILEIGPGAGVLTQELAKKAKKVIAIEKDIKICKVLKETIGNYENIEVINDDVLKTNFQFSKNYKVVANIPYYITAPLIRTLLENENQPELIILMVQKEVAQRICAESPKMNLLAVCVQFYAKPEIIDFVSKNSFWPKPKVDSAIIKLEIKKEQVPRKREQKLKIDKNLFFKIVKAGFSQPRKQLVNNLSILKKQNGVELKKEVVGSWLLKNNIKPTQRAESLSIEEWINLTKSFNQKRY